MGDVISGTRMASNEKGWTWTALRKINYYLANSHNCTDEAVRTKVRRRGLLLPRLFLLREGTPLRRRTLVRAGHRLRRGGVAEKAPRRSRHHHGSRDERPQKRNRNAAPRKGCRPRNPLVGPGSQIAYRPLRRHVAQIPESARCRQVSATGRRRRIDLHLRKRLLALQGGNGTPIGISLQRRRQTGRGHSGPHLQLRRTESLPQRAVQHPQLRSRFHAPFHEPLPHGRRFALHRKKRDTKRCPTPKRPPDATPVWHRPYSVRATSPKARSRSRRTT